MKYIYKLLILISLVLIPNVSFAAPCRVPAGCTGFSSASTGRLIYGDTSQALGTDSDLSWDPTANLLTIIGSISTTVRNLFSDGFKLNSPGTSAIAYNNPTLALTSPDSISLTAGSIPFNVDGTDGVYVLNNQAYRAKDTGGNTRDLIKLDTSKIVNVGNSAEQVSIPNLLTDGCLISTSTVISTQTCLTGGGNSKWATSTDTTAIVPSGAVKVGVGTSTPFATLSVSTASQQNGLLPLLSIASTTKASLLNVLGNGNVGIGSSTPTDTLAISSDTTEDTGLSISGNINSFFQSDIRNTNSGSSASSDWVATANNGSPTTHYVDMGINGSGGGGQPFTVANHAYLYSIDDTLNLAALGASANIIFSTTGGLTPVERARISSTGNMGISTTSPWAKLSIGTVNQSNTSPAFVIASSSTGVATSTQFIVTGGLVGIASTTPFAKLSVANSPGITSVPIFALATTTAANVNTNILTVDGGGNIELGQANKNGQTLKFWTPSSTSFFGLIGYGNNLSDGPYVGIDSTNIDIRFTSGARSWWTASGGSRDAGIVMQTTSAFSAASSRMLVITNNNAAPSGFAAGILLNSTWATGAGTATDTDIRINRTETSLATNGNHSFFEGLVANVSKV